MDKPVSRGGNHKSGGTKRNPATARRAAEGVVEPSSPQTSAVQQTAAAMPPSVAGDDQEITALALPPAALSPAMEAYFKKCEEKLGFVPNVLKAYAFDMAKLEAFVAFYNDLMLAPSGLSKLEREMIAVAVSSVNRCYY